MPSGQCLCGAVKVTATGDAKVKAICHCESCRKWTGSVMYVNLYPAESVTIEGDLDEYKTKDESISLRKTCRVCHCPVVNDHAQAMQMMDIPSGIFGLPHEPTMHLHYAEKIMSIKDGLPKFKDMPGAFHGSDEKLEE